MNSKSTYDHAYFDALYALNQEIHGIMNSAGMNSVNVRFVKRSCPNCILNLP